MGVAKKKLGIKKEKTAKAKKSVSTQGKKRRWHPGTQALREIRKLQKGTGYLIAKAPMRRLVGEVSNQLKENIRWQASAVEAVHEAAEAYVVSVLADANLCTIHARRMTCMPKDLSLAMRLRGERM